MKRTREPEEELLPTQQEVVNRSINGPNDRKTVASNNGDTPRAAKITELDLSEYNSRGMSMVCALPPHREHLVFASYDEYETHYREQHTNRCLECQKNFPTAHLLNVHIEEMHDSFAMVKRERGEKTYSCFVEGCEKKCSTPQKRRLHLIDKHMYPKNYFFAVTRDGIDGRWSLLLDKERRPKHGGTGKPRPKIEPSRIKGHEPQKSRTVVTPTTSTNQQGTRPDNDAGGSQQNQDQKQDLPMEEKPDQEMEDLSTAMSALQFVPMSVRFGRGKRPGFAKQ